MPLASVLIFLTRLSCSDDPPAPSGPGTPGQFPLAWISPQDLELPPSSRPEVPNLTPLSGEWTRGELADGLQAWSTPLPIRLRSLFFHRPPEDMALLGAAGKRLRFSQVPRAGQWRFDAESLTFWTQSGEDPPESLSIQYARAIERERSLNQAFADLSPSEFLARSAQVGPITRRGLFLPAPARATWNLTLPQSAHFEFTPQILPPEAADPKRHSDGAELQVTLQDPAGTTLFQWKQRIAPEGTPTPARLDLSDFSGQEVRLTLTSDPGETADLDYLFLAEPRVYTRTPNPPRIVIIFVDTLRQDALGIYGQSRDTSPNLDAWSNQAAIFTEARTVAPWTLPSTRTMLSGLQPESWTTTPDLPARLGAAGWSTAFIAGNVYLSTNFDMSEHWGFHRCVNWPRAEQQIELATELLDRWSDRPVFMVLHLMDMHLPYEEPPAWRTKFAGERPTTLEADSFQRGDVTAANLDANGRAWLVGRYHNNLAYIDHQLGPLLRAMDPQDTVILLSDHGEEFWDHGGFEHGHTLYEELLRIPLIARGPNLRPGTQAAPVSLLDIAPTVLHAAGLPTDGLHGLALQTLPQHTDPRPLAFGRPLYGHRRWGVWSGTEKLTLHQTRADRVDLAVDPDEAHPGTPSPDSLLPSVLSVALGQPVAPSIRLFPQRKGNRQDIHMRVQVEGGLLAAFVADDPTLQSEAELTQTGEQVHIRWAGATRGAREVFLIPTSTTGELHIWGEVQLGDSPPIPFDRRIPAGLPMVATPIPTAAKGPTIELGRNWTPYDPPQGGALPGMDPEVAGELEALGYMEPQTSP
jgi:hypothetical protein